MGTCCVYIVFISKNLNSVSTSVIFSSCYAFICHASYKKIIDLNAFVLKL